MSRKSQTEIRELMRTQPSEFRRHLRVDVSGRPRLLSDVVKPWQLRDFEALDPSCKSVLGLDPAGQVFSFAWLGRGRGCSKTTDVAILATWLLWSAQAPISGVAVAGSKDQARLLVKAVKKLLQLNPWLRSVLQVQSSLVRNKQNDAELRILAADADLAYGILCDVILCDEIVHWQTGADLWTSLVSASGKRSNSLLVVLSNSGCLNTWQHAAFESISDSPDAYVSSTDETQTLLSPRQLAQQKKLLPGLSYARLFSNQWIPSSANALNEDDLRQCIVDYKPYPMRSGEQRDANWAFVGGADLSSTADHSAIVVLAVNSVLGKIRVATSRRFTPKGGRVDLVAVFEAMKALHYSYKPLTWFMDGYESRRWQLEFARFGARVVIQSLQGTAGAVAASALVSCVTSGQLQVSPQAESLLQDLRSFEITERNGLLKITSDRGRRGHNDEGFACLACIGSAQELCSRRFVGAPLVITTGHSRSRTAARMGAHLSTNQFSPRHGVHLDVSHGSGWVRM
jgi:hypothetical protein